MNMQLLLIKILFLIYSFNSFACRPAADFKAPSLEDNINKATFIFVGKIQKVSEVGPSKDPFGTRYKLEVLMDKIVKGKSGITNKIIILETFANTCDRLGQSLEVMDECVFFVNDKMRIISGFLSGESTVCVSKNKTSTSPDIQNRLNEIAKIQMK